MSGACSCGNDFDGDNLCMPSACQWEGIERPDSTPTERDDVAAVLAAPLSTVETHNIRAAYERDKWAGEWDSLPTAVDRLLAQRAAALAPLIAAREQAVIREMREEILRAAHGLPSSKFIHVALELAEEEAQEREQAARAEAEAKVARVEALADEWERDYAWGIGDDLAWHLRAALSDDRGDA